MNVEPTPDPEPSPETARGGAGPDDGAAEGITARQLSDAFAELFSSGESPPAERDAQGDSAAGEVPPVVVPADDEDEPEDTCPVTPRTILEALLFVGEPSGGPITAERVAELVRGVDAEEVEQLVAELNRDYQVRGCPYRIVARGAGYRMQLSDEFGRVRDRFLGKVRRARLSQAAIEVLAIVAYSQPISRDKVSRLRGVPCARILSQLVRRRLLAVERKTEDGRRQTYYSTTDRFLSVFGLADLDDLPRGQEIERR